MGHEKKPLILIADDEQNIQKLLSYNVRKMGYSFISARDGNECIKKLNLHPVNVLLLDINMPRKNGIQILTRVKDKYPSITIIMVTAIHDINTAVEAIKLGAYDYVTKPLDFERLESILRNALETNALRHKVGTLKRQLIERELFAEIVGESNRLKQTFELAQKVLQTNVNVMIIGESGTGKELLARAIHKGSQRSTGPFVAVNCAAISSEIADSLLFGHKKGAFTGATEDRPGYFEQAHGGTIFLDEIGDMELDIQAKVLRVLEAHWVRRVGEKQERRVDFRVISATNRDFSQAISENNFREDLFFRLEEYPIYLPPLRERPEDIPLLVRYFLDDFCSSHDLPEMHFSEIALQQMRQHSWPGNIRELKNAVRRAAIRRQSSVIEEVFFSSIESTSPEPEFYAPESAPLEADFPAKDTIPPHLELLEREAIQRAYIHSKQNATEAASLLGISRATFYRRLKKFGLSK